MMNTNDTSSILEEFFEFERNASAQTKQINSRGLSMEKAQNHLPPWTNKVEQLFPAFTYFGGKRKAAGEVWRRFGADIPNYKEVFSGGLSVLLARPILDMRKLQIYQEQANDSNLFLINFWRTVQHRKGVRKLIKLMNFPAHEFELLGRREEMVRRALSLRNKLSYATGHDAILAAYWLYVQRQWIGNGADDIWSSPELKMVRARESGTMTGSIEEDLKLLQARTRHVRFFLGDWHRPLLSRTQTINIGITGVFLDPPYVGTSDMYSGRLDVSDPANAVPLAARAWALRFGKFKHFRIAYCGYSHHHDDFFPRGENGWIRYPWQRKNGMSKPAEGKEREVDMIWFSPHCLRFDDDIQD